MEIDTPAPAEGPSEHPVVFNRKMRRALASSSPTNPVLRDYPLTEAAFRLLCSNMERYGNQLTEDHRAALMTILHRFTMLANGSAIGRYAYDLPCGGGKSCAATAWAATAVKMRRRYSVLICASKVEALCDLKRDMLANGVPEREVGLIHSKKFDKAKARAYIERGEGLSEDHASMPCTADNQLRQILLVTHSRARGRDKDGRSTVERHNVYRGARRNLVIWDESLLHAEHQSVETIGIEKGLGYLQPELKRENVYPTLPATVEYVRQALETIEAELQEQREHKRSPRIVHLPSLSADDLGSMVAALPNTKPVDHEATAPVRDLLEISQAPLRVVDANTGGGLVKYDIAVPRELNSVAVLDASWSIRELERLDKTLQDDPLFRGDVKRYDRVAIHHLKHSAGRGAMTREFTSKKEDRELTREVVNVVAGLPETEGVIFFTFKARGGLDMTRNLRAAFSEAGIDVDATIPVIEANHPSRSLETTPRPRFVFLTFGQETSVSAYKHCSNVIFIGALHRSEIDLSGAMVAQMDDLRANLPAASVRAIRTSEVAHVLYQGINRAACRDTIDGQAKPTSCWLMYPNEDIRPALERVMPGVQWREWTPKWMEAKGPGKIEEARRAIEGALSALPEATLRVSTRSLKATLGLSGLAPRTWTAAVAAVDLDWWALRGRSFVRET